MVPDGFRAKPLKRDKARCMAIVYIILVQLFISIKPVRFKIYYFTAPYGQKRFQKLKIEIKFYYLEIEVELIFGLKKNKISLKWKI